MAIRVGINGLGRIGRLAYRAMREKYPGRMRVVAVNDGGDPASRDTIDAAVQEYAEGPMKGMSAYRAEPLVSSDLRGDPHSSIFSALDTLVIGGDLAKVVAWYDNEWGYAVRVADLVTYVAGHGRA